jgi:hypothetical protein
MVPSAVTPPVLLPKLGCELPLTPELAPLVTVSPPVVVRGGTGDGLGLPPVLLPALEPELSLTPEPVAEGDGDGLGLPLAVLSPALELSEVPVPVEVPDCAGDGLGLEDVPGLGLSTELLLPWAGDGGVSVLLPPTEGPLLVDDVGGVGLEA